MAAGWSLVEEKRALRRALRARREALSAEERALAAERIAERLAQLPELTKARRISGFVPFRGEADPSAALVAARQRGVEIFYPRVTAERPRLRFHSLPPQAQLRAGAFGILEPPADSPEVPATELDVVLVPGLAFDRRGHRLGYGSGYYDEIGALLRAAGRGVLVGVGFDFQLIDSCPAGEGDVAIDCVVTDVRVVRPGVP